MIAALVAVAALIAALVAGVLAPYYLALLVSQITLLVLAGILAVAAVSWAGIWICGKLWGSARPARIAGLAAGSLSLVFLLAVYLAVLRPTPQRFSEILPATGAGFWQLSTGSGISYLEYDPPPGVALRSDPVIFLHGGPGLRFAPFDSDFYGKLAADGFRVYLYDQAGSGASELLPHIRDYTIARFVADLEAIRLQLHAERMILIGHSWGAELAATYMARYPMRVSKAVFHSPGPLWNNALAGSDMSHTDLAQESSGFPPLRLLAALYLMQHNPDAAENLLPQREAQALFAPLVVQRAGSLVCKGDSDKLPPILAAMKDQTDNPGFNPYVLLRLSDQTDVARDDPHAALSHNATPVILLVGECNFVLWKDALDYRKTFANLRTFYIPKAGHYIQFEQPDLLLKEIRSFLTDQPDVVPPYTGDADPANVHSVGR